MKTVKYLASVTKITTFYFLKVLYEIKDNKIRKIDDKEIVLQNNNTLKIVIGYNYQEENKKNEEILKEKFVILDLSNKNEFKEENSREVDEKTAKYICFLNQVQLEPISNYFYQIIDLSNEYGTESELRHSELKVGIYKKPILTKSFVRHGNYIMGPLIAKEINGECYFISEEPHKNELHRYQYKKISGNIAETTFIDNIYGEMNFEFLYENEKMYDYESVDFITSKQLLEIYFNNLRENEYLTQDEIDNIYKKLKSKTLFSVNRAEREKNIKEIFSANSAYSNLKKELLEIILKSDKNKEELFNDLQKKYPDKFNIFEERVDSLNKKINKSKLEIEGSGVEKEIKRLNKDKDKLEKEVNNFINNKETLSKEISILKNNQKKENQEYKNLKSQTENLKTIKEDIELEIEKLKKEKQELQTGNQSLKVTNREKIIELNELEIEKEKLEKELLKYKEKAKEEYKELLNKSIEKLKESYSRKRFDDFSLDVINEIIDTNKKTEKKCFEDNKIEYSLVEREVSENEFIDFLYDFIKYKAKREISRNDIINIILCFSQGFLTIFAGEPGTGKTSLCNLIGKSLGLFKENNSRYLEVSVEKGWTSKRDFIGYYNPLSQKFDSTNKIVFEGFEQLNKERCNKNEDYPFIITLDEANLSSMEYYWADFMNNCDLENECRSINMGENYIYYIPKTLRFLATINYDHTTEVLSPRLIDRAWIILLESNSININNLININIPSEGKIIKYGILEKFMNIDNLELDEISIEILTKVVNCMKEFGISVSPRVLKMIKNYCVIGNKYFDVSENKYIALDYAISQKLLPMLEGYGTEYENFLLKLKNIVEKELIKTNQLLENIIIKGNNNMKHFNFFCK